MIKMINTRFKKAVKKLMGRQPQDLTVSEANFKISLKKSKDMKVLIKGQSESRISGDYEKPIIIHLVKKQGIQVFEVHNTL